MQAIKPSTRFVNKVSRSLATAVSTPHGKSEGTIADVFASLSGDADLGSTLPHRFAELKKSFVKNEAHAKALTHAWRSVLATLEGDTAHIAASPNTILPEIEYPCDETIADLPLERWISTEQLDNIRKCGVAIIKGVVPEQVALEWKQRFRQYAAANPTMRGFPEDNKQVFESYWSYSQVEARSHPNLLRTTKAFLGLFHASHQSTSSVTAIDRTISLGNQLTYADRLRIRQPGDAKFALGPHIDGGGIERWEDPAFKSVWNRVLEGECDWRLHDSWSFGDKGQRLAARGDMYQGPGACSLLRPFQGWLSMSHTRRNEGTLRVFPLLTEASAYIALRPFFRPIRSEAPASKEDPRYSEDFLSAENWIFDASTSAFPGCSPGHSIELNSVTHPHLRLHKTMTSVPKVDPGDMVLWHTDLIHAVESQHNGLSDSSVMYIPAIPLTKHNYEYIQRQKIAFANGVPGPDFPGGDGEKTFNDRAKPSDVQGPESRRALGLEAFDLTSAGSGSERQLLSYVNTLL